MSLELPSNMVIKKGDFAGIFAGYFLVTNTNAKKPVVGSRILAELNHLVMDISMYNETKFNNSVDEWLKGYGIDPDNFIKYLQINKKKIVDAVGSYFAVIDLIEEYEKLAKIKQGHSVGEYIDYLGGKVKGGLMDLTGSIGDIFSNLAKHLIPILLVIVVLFLVFVYGMGKINKSK